jgi:hypothetical protein
MSGEGQALASDLRQSNLESLTSLQTQAAFLVEAGLAATGFEVCPSARIAAAPERLSELA